MIALALVVTTMPAVASDYEDQCKTVRTFLTHYIRHEFSPVRPVIPALAQNQFGPYPVVWEPVFGSPRFDAHQALVEFTATPLEKALPGKGGVLLYKQKGIWKIRQVLFYGKIPRIFNLPTRSVTAVDKAFEPTIAALAEEFVKHWQRGEVDGLMDKWYNWSTRKDEPINGLSTNIQSITVMPSAFGEPLVTYKGRATYRWGILRYSMALEGKLFLTKEGNDWKVRGNVMGFDF